MDEKPQAGVSRAFPRIRGGNPWIATGSYKGQGFSLYTRGLPKDPRKVLRERLKKVPIKHTNRPGFRSRKPGRFCMQEAGARTVLPPGAFLHFAEKCANKKQAVSWKGGGKRHCLLYRNP